MSSSSQHSTDPWASRKHPVPEDMVFQRKTWCVERCGWGVLTLIIIATVLGLFSNGPLSTVKVLDGTLEVEYERFLRNSAPTIVRLNLLQGSTEPVTIYISRSFINAHKIETIVPAPSHQRGNPDGVEMTFDTGEEQSQIQMTVRPASLGLIKNEIGIAGKPNISFTQFIFP